MTDGGFRGHHVINLVNTEIIIYYLHLKEKLRNTIIGKKASNSILNMISTARGEL
jgi:hypothetical protein